MFSISIKHIITSYILLDLVWPRDGLKTNVSPIALVYHPPESKMSFGLLQWRILHVDALWQNFSWKIPLPLIFFSFNQSLLPYLTWLKDCYFPHFCMVNKNMYSIFTPNQISGDTGHWTSSYIIKQNKLAAQAKSGRFIQVIDDYFIVVSLRITSRAGIF